MALFRKLVPCLVVDSKRSEVVLVDLTEQIGEWLCAMLRSCVPGEVVIPYLKAISPKFLPAHLEKLLVVSGKVSFLVPLLILDQVH